MRPLRVKQGQPSILKTGVKSEVPKDAMAWGARQPELRLRTPLHHPNPIGYSPFMGRRSGEKLRLN